MGISLFIQLFVIILLSPSTITNKNVIRAQAQCLGHEQTLLLELRKQLVFYSFYSTLVRWNQSEDCCSWVGVGCDDRGHVISLNLNSEGISGGLNESSSLFGLEYLEELDLSNNVLNESEIPREFHKLTHLTSLDLSYCSLKGYFPEVIFHLPTLQDLDLSNNPLLGGAIPQFSQNNSFQRINLAVTNFSGSLPDSVGNLKRLSFLQLSDCKFTGLIPPTLGNLTRLEQVILSHNFFTGSISSFHFQPLSNIEYINLSNNSLSGTIPTSLFTTLPSLRQLDLSNNQFSGHVSEFPVVNISTQLSFLDLSSNRLESPIPNSLFSLHSLTDLMLSHNLFNDTFQQQKILSLPNLQNLDLSSNNLSLDDSTSIPSSSEKISLKHFDLSNNEIAGEIPSWIWEIVSGEKSYLNLSCNVLVGLQKPYNIPPSFYIERLDLHSNKLQDELPSSLILGTRYADLSNNRLSGSFPTSICNTTNLQYLDLSCNNLSGTIPPCLFQNLKSLDVLNLGRNRISGYIPDKFPTYCYLASLDLSDNNLVGEVPLSISNCTSLQVLNLSGNKLGGTVPTNLPLLGKLAALNLGRNNITGHIPNFTADCPLQNLVLNDNNFIGEVPTSLANCKVLEVMNVGGNHIDGGFPCMLPSSLRVLVLRSNKFHGDITCHNKSWPSLQIIDITSNNFSGSLNPFNFSTLRGMMRDTVTKLSYKNLGVTTRNGTGGMVRGPVKTISMKPDFSAATVSTTAQPSSGGKDGDERIKSGGLRSKDGDERKKSGSESFQYYTGHSSLPGYYTEEVTLTIKGVERKLVKIWPDFTSIDFSNNNFHGGIPDSIGGLDALYLLNLSHNSLTGTVPKSFGKLRQLESLDLSVNRLRGKIPEEIARSTFLQTMNVSHNELEGKIPVSTQIQSFPTDFFEGNLGLCGLPLNVSCSNTPVPPPPQGNGESGREIEWEYVFVSAGYAVGLGSFLWLLLFCRSFRYKYFEKVDDFFNNILYRRQHNKRRDRRRRRAVRNEVRRR